MLLKLKFIFKISIICNLLIFRDVDQVHDMMEDIAEQQDVAREISDAISNPVSFGQDMDEDELERELEELEQEELDKDLLKIGPSPEEMPSPPTAEPAAIAKTKSIKIFFFFKLLLGAKRV